MRLFIAVLIDATIRERAVKVQQALRQRLLQKGISWVKSENLHFTLRFLGEQPESRLPNLRTALQEAVQGQAPFEIEVGGVGVFPNLRRPAVLWIGLQRGEEAMGELFTRIETALRGQKFEPESRPFHAHLTLARLKKPVRDLESALQAVSAAGIGSLTVDALSLMQSQLHPDGAIYTELDRFDFGV